MTDDYFPHKDVARENHQVFSLNAPNKDVSKRVFDLFGSFTGLVLLSPILLVMSVLVKVTSKGPVLFKQKRHGLNGELFTVYKFRTMHLDMGDPTGVRQTIKDDPRVTRVGKFLRKSNFDELPQLLNVLFGDMSLVGPRPHVPGMLANGVPYEEFDPRYQSRHVVKPGITGLAQVKGFRGETKDAYAAKMRLEYDLAYVKRRSVFFDMQLILVTVVKEFFKREGY